MKWRWLFFDYVDPQLNLSREERRAVRRLVGNARNLRQTPALASGRRFRWVDLVLAYWLRGLSDAADRCPECGHERTHQV